MKTKYAIRTAIKQALITGKRDTPLLLLKMDSSPKEVKRFHKQLRSSPDWRVQEDTVWASTNTYFNGIASWGQTVAIDYAGYTHRFRLLRLDWLGTRSIYAIPIRQVDSFSELPDIALNSDEVFLIKQMASELLHRSSAKETWTQILHPSKPNLKEQRRQWKTVDFAPALLLNMLEKTPVLKELTVATLDAQCRCFIPASRLPAGIFNFVLPSKNLDTDLWFYKVLQALTFTTSSDAATTGPVIVTVKDTADPERWRQCCEQVTVLQTFTGSLLWPLLEKLEETERILKCGGTPAAPFISVPISLSKTVFGHSLIADIALPKEPNPLHGGDLDMLRAAMSRLVKRDVAERAYDLWRQQRAVPTAYRQNGFQVWRDVLLQTALATWFSGQDMQAAVEELCSEAQQRQEVQERMIAEKLQRGLDLLTSPKKYEGEIIDRPGSLNEWNTAMQDGTIAFRLKLTKGPEKGKELLAFSPNTLHSLLLRVGCDEILYDRFLDRCDKQGILDSRKRAISLGGSTFNGITFDVEKF